MIISRIQFKFIGLIVLISSLIFVNGCNDDREELDRYIYKIKSRPAKKIEPIPEFTPLPKYKYPEDQVRRNPFKPVEKEVDDSAAPDPNRRREPLEEFPLDALKFVGTLKRNSTVWALIEQPGGRISRIKAGEYMGKNYGKVLAIEDNTIKLEETVKVSGKWVKKITKLQLHTKESGS
ncbi:pilus assembly protein PilP [Legionella israelensis]|uniref:pilus assembly protein PilP n=1 Tax=Legionella israelensis TaxID=454 RepID=UPI00117FDBA8|nr:pilus assembly protein PilP [Legionella israelensis]QDP72890.1 pilus assembly protein PilP [Legionella israelensis]